MQSARCANGGETKVRSRRSSSMTNKSEWQEANRRVMAEQREKLGEPPTADEMLAYSRGELSESEEERIRDLLVAYPELSRMYAAPFAEEAEPGVSKDR